MTKEELQVKIGTIESMISDSNIEISKYAGQLADLKKQHADLSKPKLTPQQYDKLQTLVEEAVESFDFDDTENYSLDFHIDYDNRIAVESLTFDNADEVVRSIMENIEGMFAEATCPPDDSDNS
jgi:hypothetical protein